MLESFFIIKLDNETRGEPCKFPITRTNELKTRVLNSPDVRIWRVFLGGLALVVKNVTAL